MPCPVTEEQVVSKRNTSGEDAPEADHFSLILTYLIPCRLITQHAIPSAKLLAEAPGLARLIGPLVACIKKGDLTGFDRALADGEPEFVRRRIFLTLERSRDITLRNLLRKVYLAAGYDDLKEGQTEKDRIRKSRIPLIHFATALRMGIAGEGSGQAVEDDEVECLLANQIFKVRAIGPHKCFGRLPSLLHALHVVARIVCIGAKPPMLSRLQSITTTPPPYHDSMLTFPIGAHEGLYLARARHGSDEQEGCVSRNRGLIPTLDMPAYCDRLSMVVPHENEAIGCALRHVTRRIHRLPHMRKCAAAQLCNTPFYVRRSFSSQYGSMQPSNFNKERHYTQDILFIPLHAAVVLRVLSVANPCS